MSFFQNFFSQILHKFFQNHFSQILSKNCVLYANNTGQVVTCSFAVTCDVMHDLPAWIGKRDVSCVSKDNVQICTRSGLYVIASVLLIQLAI